MVKFSLVGRGALIASVLLFAGCAAMPFANSPQIGKPSTKPALPDHYKDYTGVVHVHTRYSYHSTGTFEEVAKSAQKAHADFVIITDHNTLEALREKREHLYGNALLLIGTELDTKAGHLGVFGVQEEINPNADPKIILKKIQKEARRSETSSFICHAYLELNPWTDWSLAPGVTGMEIYNLPAAMYKEGFLSLGVKGLFYSPRAFVRSFIDRPDALLNQWDKMLAERKFVGIGSVDAHQRFRFFGKAMDSYEAMFEAVQTHVFARELSRKAIFEAFQKGHAYVGFDIVQPVRNFLFVAKTPKGMALMGDSVRYGKELKFQIFLPEKAQIHVMKDGKLWKTASGDQWEEKPDGVGVYRVEIYLNDKLWILSNPIYVRKSSKSA